MGLVRGFFQWASSSLLEVELLSWFSVWRVCWLM
jgi:hypothetical protein